MVYITGDWQFRVSSQFLLLLQPKQGKSKGKRNGGTPMGHAGSEAAGWVRSDEPPSFFVVFQVQRSPWSPILGWWSLGGDGQSL